MREALTALAATLSLCLALWAGGPEAAPTPDSRAADLSYLTRACLRCHSVRGPNRPLYNERGKLDPGLPRERLRWAIPYGIREGEYQAKTEQERRDLARALELLRR